MNIPYTIILPTAYGQMLVNRFDINQTNHLFKTNAAIDHQEIMACVGMIRELGRNGIILDIGANFGTWSLAMSQIPGCEVHAFEPQRILANMICGSVAINSIENVTVLCSAAGNWEGRIDLPKFDYRVETNFGSIEFGPMQNEVLTQKRGQSTEHVPIIRIDDHYTLIDKNVIFMKIDAEGMEMDVLCGSEQLIRNRSPLMYVEHLKNDKRQLQQYIESFGYNVIDTGMNFLCKPL